MQNEEEPKETGTNGLSAEDADIPQPPQDPNWRPDSPRSLILRAPSSEEDEIARARRRSDLGGF